MHNYKKYNMLIVDQDDFFRHELSSILISRFNCENVHEARDGNQAWDIIQDTELDGVICERDLPGMSGLELLLKLQESDHYTDLPVFMLFKQSDKDSVIKAIHLGASEMLSKPFTTYDFGKKLRRMLLLKERRQNDRCDILISNTISAFEGPALYSNGKIINISSSGLLAHMKCVDQLKIHKQLDLRIQFHFTEGEIPSKTIRSQVIRIERPPSKTDIYSAYYAFVFVYTRPDQRVFLENILKKLKEVSPEIIK